MPNNIASIILLSKKRTGAFVVLVCLEKLIKNHPSFYNKNRQKKIIADLRELLSTPSEFPPVAMSFPTGKRVNITRNKYLSKSPLLGLIAEFLAYGEQSYHLPLLQIYINLYFHLAERFNYSDADYLNWLTNNNVKILGIYQSIIEKTARQLRIHIASNDLDLSERLLKVINEDSFEIHNETARSIRRLNLYCNGLRPISRHKTSNREIRAKHHQDEHINTYAIVNTDGDEIEVEQKVIEQKIPKYINSTQDLLRQHNKMKGRATQISRQMQLRALDRNFLRPSAWIKLDLTFFDENIDIQTRALICLSLLVGRSLETCHEKLKAILKKKDNLSISLNIPTVSSNKENFPVNNTLIIPIPFRYRYLISSLLRETPQKVVNSAKATIKAISSEFDISPIKIARLFFFMSNAQSSKTFAAILFDNPLPTIATQLHYSLTTQEKLAKIYSDVFQEFEQQLPNPQGIEDRTYSDVSGIANFPRTDAIQTILQKDNFNRNMLRGFFLYASAHGSRGVVQQAADSFLEIDRIAYLVIANDKKRDGAEHARTSILQRKCLTDVFGFVGLPSLKPSKVFFTYLSKGIQHPLSPRHFSAKGLPKNLRMNSIRKIRRSVWLNRGMDEEIIDALYGHHYVGTVPISSQSSLSLLLIYQSALPHIQDFSLLIEQLINEK